MKYFLLVNVTLSVAGSDLFPDLSLLPAMVPDRYLVLQTLDLRYIHVGSMIRKQILTRTSTCSLEQVKTPQKFHLASNTQMDFKWRL